jgi:hypothetical protein
MDTQLQQAIARISEIYERVSTTYAEEVVPGISDNSVLEAERDTLEIVLGILHECAGNGENR